MPILRSTSCQYALENPIRKHEVLKSRTPPAMILVRPSTFRKSEPKPTRRLEMVNTAMKAGPARTWYSRPLPL